MSDGKEAGSVATPDKSQDTSKNFNERFNAQLEAWRAEGCKRQMDGAEGIHDCGARPHRVRMLPEDVAGDIAMSVDCSAGHEGVWVYKVPAVEMQADMERQAEAARTAAGGRDPMVATLKISMNLRTQQVDIEPFVPTPGLGIQLAGILMSHFFAQMQESVNKSPANGLFTPGPKKLLDRNGKPVMS